MAVKVERQSEYADVINAIERLTAAVLTLAMQTANAKTQYAAGDINDIIRTRVLEAYGAACRHIVHEPAEDF